MARAVAVAFLLVAALPIQGMSRTVDSPRWSLGYTLWSENISLVRADGRSYRVLSSARAFAFGYQLDRLQREYGWFIEGQLLAGDANVMSEDPNLVFMQPGLGVQGVAVTAIRHWNFENPRLFVGIGLSSLFRQIKLQAPEGYSFDKEAQAARHHVRLDFSFPLIERRMEVFNQFGIPVDGHGHIWQFGLRHR